MLGEFLLRLAVALPIICGLAALSLYATKRGWLKLPGLLSSGNEPRAGAPTVPAQLAILSVKSLTPAARIAVVRFAGRDLLLGLSGQSLTLLAEAGPATLSDLPDAAPRPAELREIAS